MKKIFCPKCDEAISLSSARLRELREKGDERHSIVCPSCTQQLRIRLRSPKAQEDKDPRGEEASHYGYITVLENVFGYKQRFALRKGINRIGRRNKDTETDIPIITGDPSMDRHHCIIKVSQTKSGATICSLIDHESRVGTFVAGNLLGLREQYNLSDGDVFTLGATSIIFSSGSLPEEEAIEGERLN